MCDSSRSGPRLPPGKEGQLYLRDGDKRKWLNNDLQSFHPLRFMPPELMGYQGGRLLSTRMYLPSVTHWELLSRDIADKALMCRPKSGNKGKRMAPGQPASCC